MLWAKQRTWGWYLTLLRTPWLCVKLLRFAPGGRLSNQRHRFRNEWWVILKGKGLAIFDERKQDGSIESWFAYTDVGPAFAFVFHRNRWHSFKAESNGKPVYAMEIQWGKVSELDIERWPV